MESIGKEVSEMKVQSLKILLESEGGVQVERKLRDLVRKREIKLAGSKGKGDEVSLAELYESFVGIDNLLNLAEFQKLKLSYAASFLELRAFLLPD
jgi:hypothetical protein